MRENEILDVVSRFATNERPIYLVGGSVRDRLLRHESHDLDFILPSGTYDLACQVANTLKADLFVLDDQRDTTRVVIRKEGQEQFLLDFAAFRAADLEADLWARDFRINAIAIDLRDPNHWIDPCGGAIDLREKRLRACLPTSFSSDPVRILRAARLAVSLGLRIDSATLQWIREAVDGLLRISGERVRDELNRIMELGNTALALRLLKSFGVLPVLWPELDAMDGVTQSPPHVQPVWEHTLEALTRLESLYSVLVEDIRDETSGGLVLAKASLMLGRYREKLREHYAAPLPNGRKRKSLLKLALLYHDAGKPLVRTVEEDGRIRFLGHEDLSVSIMLNRARELAYSNLEMDILRAIIGGHMRIHSLADAGANPSRRAIYRYFRDLGVCGVDVGLLSLADAWATYSYGLPEQRWNDELETCRALYQAYWEKPVAVVDPPRLLTGEDLKRQFALKPGKIIGEMLEMIRESQAAGEITTREEAIAAARTWLERSKGVSNE
ncbi:MAG: HD domain-containing protein [Anaerolineae bacterium]|nr:HD domain-containing protein [Anaerolineae bacterium]